MKYNLALATEQPSSVAPALKRRWWVGALGGLAAGIVLTFLLIQPREEDTLASLQFTPIAVEAESQSSPAFSPDGKSIAYIKNGPPDKIMLRQLDRDVAVELADGRDPFWSPDSRFVYYQRVRNLGINGEFWRVSVTGGAPELVVKGESATVGVFTPDGGSLFVLRSGRIQASSPPGAEPKDPPNGVHFPDGIRPTRFAPDGTKWWGVGKGRSRIVSYPQGKSRELPAGIRPMDWFPDSRHMFVVTQKEFRRSDGLAIFDSETLETRTVFTSPARILRGALAPDGKRVVIDMGAVDWNIQEFTTDGKLTRDLVATSLSDGAPEWSPRGDRLAYISESSGAQDVWMRDDDGSHSTLLLKSRGAGRLRFSPDGRRIAFLL